MMAARIEAVRGCLARVDDPELDEPVTELGFVTDIAITPEGAVAIGFRLPTYWCAANFAFIMADDMRRAVGALPWVSRVDVTLGEHMYAEKINHGMAQGLSFQETFGSEASGDLLELRRTFLLKAFQRRQDSLLRHLLAAGHEPAAVLGLSVAALQGLALEAEAARLRARYLDRRPVPAPVTPDARAFVDTDGETLTADQLPSYLKALARVGVNAEFNGAICRGLLAARFAGTAPAGEPTLLDFIRQPPSAHPAI